jgi:glycosyltransferase involved in cell wall biosynthesis
VRWTAQSRSCLGLAIHSHHAAQSYRDAGVAADKILVAHNGAEPRRMGVPMRKAEARARLVLPPDRPIAVYAGRLNHFKGLDQLLALAALRPETLFLLIGSEGDGPIERMAAAHDNVRVLPWQEPASLPAWLYAADVLLIPASRDPLERYRTCVLPMKLFAYLASGRPIIAPEAPDTAELLVDEHNALLVTPASPPAAAAALDRLLADPKLAETLGTNGRALAEELSWDARARRITDFIRSRMIAAPARSAHMTLASIAV